MKIKRTVLNITLIRLDIAAFNANVMILCEHVRMYLSMEADMNHVNEGFSPLIPLVSVCGCRGIRPRLHTA